MSLIPTSLKDYLRKETENKGKVIFPLFSVYLLISLGFLSPSFFTRFVCMEDTSKPSRAQFSGFVNPAGAGRGVLSSLELGIATFNSTYGLDTRHYPH